MIPLLNFLRKIGFISVPSQPPETLKEHNDLLIPRYPPVDFGIPVCPPEILLERNRDIVDSLMEIVSNRQLFDEHYLPAMLRLANMVQLLPASATHHHRAKGGLLRHSLEVGLWAVQLAEGEIAREVVIPTQGGSIDPRWRFAVFIAGIGHDLGKIVTDLTVTDRSQESKWSPYSGGIYDWSIQNDVGNYLIHWQEGRGKRHVTISSTLIDTVMKQDSLNWISEDRSDEVIWIHESLNSNPGETNNIHRFVVAADQLSVRKDLKSLGRLEPEADKSPGALQRAGSSSENTSKKSVVPRNNPSATHGNLLGQVAVSDVPQHNPSASDESQHDQLPHRATPARQK